MKKLLAVFAVAGLVLVGATPSFSKDDKTTMVGGQTMYPSRDIVDNAVNSADHTTLVAAVKAAGLVETLKGPGPFTVFAPTNEAFAKLPAGTVETLLKPENHDTLVKILTYHVVPGRLSTPALRKQIHAGNGQASARRNRLQGEVQSQPRFGQRQAGSSVTGPGCRRKPGSAWNSAPGIGIPKR